MHPEKYLSPENFTTDFDCMAVHKEKNTAAEQYKKGLETGSKCNYLYFRPVSNLHAWGGSTKTGGWITAYETIGLHVCTSDLLRGFLDSKVDIVIYNNEDTGPQKYLLRYNPRRLEYEVKPLPETHPAYY